MMIRLTQVFAILAGLGAVSLFSGPLVAAPSGLPQNMVPAYMPASPSQGIVRFRPQYRLQQPPMRYLPSSRHVAQHGRVPVQYRPVRRSMAWPLPVSYRPIVQAPRPPVGRYNTPWSRYGQYRHPAARQFFQGRPVARVISRYPYAQRPMPWRGQPPVYSGYRGYRSPVPANFRQPAPWGAVRSAMYAPVYGYPQPQISRNTGQVNRAMPRRLARYQPYFSRPGVPRNYNFRPSQATVMNVPRPGYQQYPPLRGYPVRYQYRPDLRYPVAARQVYPAQMVPGRNPENFAYRSSDAVAWADAPYSGRY
ncbi:MAG: hypothetical protein OQL27_10625 [Sedimenticola sp.]|nr:hypothetical protein [Sedimenticola sp.]